MCCEPFQIKDIAQITYLMKDILMLKTELIISLIVHLVPHFTVFTGFRQLYSKPYLNEHTVACGVMPS